MQTVLLSQYEFLTTVCEFCQTTQFVIDVNIPGDFQQDEMKSLKLKMKVGVIRESCDSGWVFFLILCSISHFSLAVLFGLFGYFYHIFYIVFILQLPHDSSFCQLYLLSVLFPKFSSHFPSPLSQPFLQMF